MEIQLTKKGHELAAMLVERTQHPRVPRSLAVQTQTQLITATGTEQWSLANDALILLGGYWTERALQAETLQCTEVACVVSAHLEIACVVAEEILAGLITESLVDIQPLPPSLEQVWCMQVAGVLGNDLRLRIILALREGPLTTSQIRELIGPIHVMTVRYHMEALRVLELVQVAKEGRLNEYTLDPLVIYVYMQRLQRLFLTDPWGAVQKRPLT